MLKRLVAGSFLALALAAPAVVSAAALTESEQQTRPVLVYCISCGTHHLIEI